MKKEEEIKRIELTLDDIQGSLDRISLVSEPAIELDFFYFNKENFEFKVEYEEKRIVTGPAMVPEQDIIRINPITGEKFFVYFTKDTVMKCAEMFFKNSDVNSSNLEHEFDIDGVTVFESWIVDKENGKGGGKNFNDIPDGTWMISYKIDNDVVWEDFIKTGLVTGFSIEGVFIQKFMKLTFSDDLLLKEIDRIINEYETYSDDFILEKLKELYKNE